MVRSRCATPKQTHFIEFTMEGTISFSYYGFSFFQILPFVLGFPFLGAKVLVLVDSACRRDVDSILMVSLWHNVDHLFLRAVTSLKDFLPRSNLLFETRLEIMTQGKKLGLSGINASSRMFQALANSFIARVLSFGCIQL